MEKFKVEILHTNTYIIDVLAENIKEARIKAMAKWNEVNNNGTSHYYETEDSEISAENVYNVSSTDDPFNP